MRWLLEGRVVGAVVEAIFEGAGDSGRGRTHGLARFDPVSFAGESAQTLRALRAALGRPVTDPATNCVRLPLVAFEAGAHCGAPAVGDLLPLRLGLRREAGYPPVQVLLARSLPSPWVAAPLCGLRHPACHELAPGPGARQGVVE